VNEPVSRRYLVILNPASRRERAGRIWARSFPESGRAEVVLSRSPGHARELAAKAASDGYDVVAAAGGDGTVNEVTNGIVGSRTALGILPIGSVNVLAAELAIPRGLEKAWQVILEGESKAIDLGKVTGTSSDRVQPRYFAQLAGVGLDARAIRGVSRTQKRIWGPLAYVFAGLKAVAEAAPQIRVEVDGSEAVEGICAIFGNGRYYGGPFTVLKDARVDDGLLDICLFKRGGYLNIFNYLVGVLRGAHTDFRDVWYLKGRRVKVTSTGDVPVEVDGELSGSVPVEIEVVPNALRVMVSRSVGSDNRDGQTRVRS
jgi:diacylglycerol kinase (ATP)